MASPITRRDPESVATEITVTFDEEYLQSVLDEFNAENSQHISLDDAKKFLIHHMMDETYYSFQEWLEGKGQ